ncbi:hypothetical protein ACJQWK_02532 [Exserohilum turcicum]
MGKQALGQRLCRQRSFKTSHRECLASIACLHTESINIWSHLLATLWFFASICRFAGGLEIPYTTSTAATLFYLVANIVCFACSTLYHVFANHARANAYQYMDHLGITAVIWASSISLTTLSFESHPKEQWMHGILISIVAALCFLYLLCGSQYGSSDRQNRIYIHTVLGSLAMLSGLRNWQIRWARHRSGQLFTDFAIMVLFNGVGGAIYATHLLDKTLGTKLGTLDISHNAMHILFIVGSVVYEQSLMRTYHDMLDE